MLDWQSCQICYPLEIKLLLLLLLVEHYGMKLKIVVVISQIGLEDSRQ